MENIRFRRLLEAFLAPPSRLSVKITNFLHWGGFLQAARNAGWRARLAMLGKDSIIHKHVVVHSPEKLSIGSRCAIAEFVHIWAGGGVSIGDDVLISSHSVITSLSHDVQATIFRNSLTRSPIVIEDNVWIGTGSIILPGVTIGAGSVIGAGAVVTKNIPTGAIAKGVPARVSADLSVDKI